MPYFIIIYKYVFCFQLIEKYQGDGGSPLMCELGGRWFVAGLVAWGIGCATSGVPGVYVNVASYVPWIQTTVVS